jgi:hypothetical protein
MTGCGGLGLVPGVLFGGKGEDAMVKPWHGECVAAAPPLITPGLDPGVFFGGHCRTMAW